MAPSQHAWSCRACPPLSPSAAQPSSPSTQTAAAIFAGVGEGEVLGVKAVMRKLSRGVVRRGRTSSAKGSVVGAAAGLKSKSKRGELVDGRWLACVRMGSCRSMDVLCACKHVSSWAGCSPPDLPTRLCPSVTGGGALGEASMRALEALRQEWIAREVQRSQPPLPSAR